MCSSDVDEVVEIHLASFPEFFLTFLGRRFLRLLYEHIVADDVGVALVSTDGEGRMTGFVAGVTEQGRFYRRLAKQRKWRFAWAATRAVLDRPSIVPRLVRGLNRSSEASDSGAPACLMSIAVRPGASGRGEGRHLIAGFSDEMRRRSVPTYCLTTDRDGNDRVNAFYRTLGFQLARTFVTAEGRPMNEYVISTGFEIR
jgi:GNAT superfamily N-acetyltransferase